MNFLITASVTLLPFRGVACRLARMVFTVMIQGLESINQTAGWLEDLVSHTWGGKGLIVCNCFKIDACTNFVTLGINVVTCTFVNNVKCHLKLTHQVAYLLCHPCKLEPHLVMP